MGRCSVGRATQKYTSGSSSSSGGADLSSILVAHGDMIYANSSIEAANISIGQTTGHVLTIISPGEVGWQGVSGASGQVGTLQSVTTNGSTTDIETGFLNTVTSLTASGNVVVAGNVTATSFMGDGSQLTGIPSLSNVTTIENNLIANATRITSLESYVTGGQSGEVLTSTGSTPVWSSISPSLVGLPSPYTSGDILYATSATQLAKLTLGQAGQVLKSDGIQPVWSTDLTGSGGTGGTSVWTETGINNVIYYNSGKVGISTDAPTTDLQVGSNVNISDTDVNKILVTGNVYVSKNMKVLDDVDCFQVRTTNIFIKKQVVSAHSSRTSAAMII